MQSQKDIIAVVGATGNQGGSVVKAILNKREVRALTRDPSKVCLVLTCETVAHVRLQKAAKDLEASGADVVALDMDGDISVMAEALQVKPTASLSFPTSSSHSARNAR